MIKKKAIRVLPSHLDYAKIFDSFNKKRIMIIGDVMVDAYMFGKVERISPEAPVPVVAIEKHDLRLGGAANVALNIAAMGAEPILCTIVGKDDKGKNFARLLKKNHISDQYLCRSSARCTTTKFRIMGNNTQLLRVDEEDTQVLNEQEQKDFLSLCLSVLKKEKIDAIIFEDYDKGLLSEKVIRTVIEEAQKKGIPITVDPKKRNFLFYKNVTLFKPNLKEMREGLKLEKLNVDEKSVGEVAEKLRNILQCKMLMVTLSEDGVLIQSSNTTVSLPACLRKIADVSGAGDTVISVATLCLTQKMEEKDIAYISNMAGGLVCEYVGVVPINKNELLRELQGSN
ncbi:MAG: PfkB family carbohydrate kinase [Bacteroidales bacterium]